MDTIRQKCVRALAAAALASALSGCVWMPVAVTGPLEVETLFWEEGQQQERLIVFLPGRSDSASDFKKRGLWQALRERGIAADAAAVDMSMAYYRNETAVKRLMEEVLAPARRDGYREIWVVGNSLGGFGAFLAEKHYPGVWDRMYLLAPFMGDDEALFVSVNAAGGLADWAPGDPRKGEGFQWEFWRWLRRFDPGDKVRVGYGSRDRLKEGIELWTPRLAPEQIFVLEGEHRWSVWTEIWERMLDAEAESVGRESLAGSDGG